jgi:glycine/D-amino acid oxidase-like deaminating enzyme
MTSKVDYIIVGQGLVGTWMSYYAQKAGKSCIVINDPHTPSATAVASGVINPVTGRRIVQTWMIDVLLPNAIAAYKELGKHLNETLIREAPVVLLHPSLQMKESFEYRLTHDNVYLSTNNASDFSAFFATPFGTGQINSSYWIDLNTMLAAWKKQLQQANSFLSLIHI